MLKEFLTNMAESIRTVLHTEEKINAQDFSSKIPEVYEAGYEKGLTEAEPTIEPLTITENGTYTAPDGVDGYSPITVEVESEGNGSVVNPDWTDWSYLFYQGARSEIIEKLKFTDSYNVVNFNGVFYNCSKLTSIPELDTSNGISFYQMFYKCSNLISIPELDTSNGTDFSNMFYNCSSLASIPELDTSNGKNFDNMFYNCSSLASIPELDTSNGTSFNSFMRGCRLLTSVPAFDISNATNINSMFDGCSQLVAVPQLNTENITNFYNLFNNCSKLTSIPKLNLSKGTNYSGMFSGCKVLVEIGFEGTFNVSANNTTFLTTAPNVNQESLHKLIDCMVKTGTASTYTIGIGSSNLARVSQEYIQKALDKGIVLQ